jgi:hypothetical protein
MMKKRFSAAVLMLVAIALSDCHRARKIEGQVFVVTEGGQSIKLGLVEVFAYNRGEVDEALKKVDAKRKDSREAARVVSQQFDDLVKRASAAKTAAEEKELGSAAAVEAGNFYFDLLEVQRLFQERTNYLLSSQPYFAALPTPVARAKTDADGNFAISVPPLGSFVIGATAQRVVGHEVERYVWLVTTDRAGSQKLTLSNDNLASVGGENSLLKTEGDEDHAKDCSREEGLTALTEILAKYPLLNVEQPEVYSVLAAMAYGTAHSNDKFVTLTKSVSFSTANGSVTLQAGSKLQFKSQATAKTVWVHYGDADYEIPASATDLAK